MNISKPTIHKWMPYASLVLSLVLSLTIYHFNKKSNDGLENTTKEFVNQQMLLRTQSQIHQSIMLFMASSKLNNRDLAIQGSKILKKYSNEIQAHNFLDEKVKKELNMYTHQVIEVQNNILKQSQSQISADNILQLIKISQNFTKEYLKSSQNQIKDYENHAISIIQSHNSLDQILKLAMIFVSLLIGFSIWSLKKQLEAERAISESEKLYRILFSSLSEGVILCLKNGQIVVANHEAGRIFGVTHYDHLVGSNLQTLLPKFEIVDKNKNKHETLISDLLNSKSYSQNVLIQFKNQKNETFYCNLVAQPLMGGEEDKVLSIIFTFSDITDKVKAEMIIAKQQAEIVHTSRLSSLGEMASGIAHEINNPLAIISGHASKLENLAEKGSLDSTDIVERSKKIKNTSFRISKIIKGLLNFSRDGKNDPKEVYPVIDLINDTLDLTESRLKSKGIRLTRDEIPEKLTLKGRPIQLSQVLLNLIINSLHAIENTKDPWIHLGIQSNENYIELSVTDSGHGIPMEVQKNIFQPFFTTKEIGVGTGLGLSIAHQIILDHGGVIEIDNNSPNTKIYFRIPHQDSNELSCSYNVKENKDKAS